MFSCGGANLTCSGTTSTAQYAATGTPDQTLTVTVSPTINLVKRVPNVLRGMAKLTNVIRFGGKP